MGRVLSVLGLSILVAISTVSSVSPSSMLGGTGVVRGTVTVTAVPAVDRPAVSALTGHTHDPADRQRAVVYLHTAPRQAFDDLRPGRVSMDQRGEQFVPRVLAITVGTTVEFPNNDRTFHNVFSLSRVRTFDLGRYRPGRTGRVTFDRPGEVPVFCDIHSHMSAYILVFSHPFFAVTGRRTSLRLPTPGPFFAVTGRRTGP